MLSAALMDLRMADGLWRQSQKIEQEAKMPTCENSDTRLAKPSTEAGLNSVQPLHYCGKEFCHFVAQWSMSLPVSGSLK